MLKNFALRFWQSTAALQAAAAVLLVLGVAVWAAVGALWAFKQPSFAVKTLQFEGLRGAADLARFDDVFIQTQLISQQRGTVLTTSLAAVESKLQEMPWVRRATVRRVLPDTLHITLEAHQAMARFNGSSLINTFGEVFIAESDAPLPNLHGAENEVSLLAQRLLNLNEWLKPTRLGVQTLRYSDRRAWQAQLDNGLMLELGRDDMNPPMAQRVKQLAQHWRTLSSAQASAPQGVDLRYSRGFALQF